MLKSYFALVGVTACVACGSSFDSSGAGGGTGVGGDGQAGSTATGGHTSSGGTGSSGTGTGGTSSGGSGAAGGSAAGTGGSSAVGGSPAGGSGGVGGGVDCAAMKADYSVAVEKARVCDAGSMDECSTSSTLPTFGCGCPVLVNAKSDATASAKEKYKAIQDAKCPSGPICNIACLAYTSAACTAQAAAAGTGYVCTGTSGVATN